MPCKRCNSNSIFCQGRELCKSCYTYVRENNLFNQFPKKDLFKTRLQKRHGPGIISDLKSTLINLDTNQSMLGKKYKLTRERIRQFIVQLYGAGNYKKARVPLYGQLLEKRRIQRFDPNTRIINDGNWGKNFIAKKIVYNKLVSLGFQPTYHHKDETNYFQIGEIKILVKDCGKSSKTCSTGYAQYFKVHLTKNEHNDQPDFIIAYVDETQNCYVIPGKRVRGEMLYIRKASMTKNKINTNSQVFQMEQFKEAWHLLK